jgi:hypothetical protein
MDISLLRASPRDHCKAHHERPALVTDMTSFGIGAGIVVVKRHHWGRNPSIVTLTELTRQHWQLDLTL